MTAGGPASGPVINLHIGTMKTGTSYLQAVLARNAVALAEHGVLYPTEASHGFAARQILGLAANQRASHGAWNRLVDTARAWDGHAVVISSEFFSFASDETAQHVVAALEPSQVRVVVGARDLLRLLPSAWQNKVKHGRAWEFSKYAEKVMLVPDAVDGPARSFWHHHDIPAIVGRWTAAVGAANVTVLTVPPPGSAPDALWRRFCQIIEVPPDEFDATPDKGSNLSLGFAQTELLRRVNRLVREDIDRESHRRHVQSYFANTVLRPDPQASQVDLRPVLSAELHDWTIKRSERMVRDIEALGPQVVGDLRDLVPAPLTDEERSAEPAPAPDIPDAVVRAVTKLLLRVVRLQRGQPPSGPDDDEPTGPADAQETWRDDEDDTEDDTEDKNEDDPEDDHDNSPARRRPESDGLPAHRDDEDRDDVPAGAAEGTIRAPAE